MCGRGLLDFRCEPEHLLFLLDDAKQDRVSALCLDNTRSLRALRLKLESPHPALVFDPSGNQQAEIDLPEGQKSEVFLRFNLGGLDQGQESLEVELRLSFPGAILAARKIPVRMGRRPEIQCWIEEFPKLQMGATARTKGHLRQTAGIPVRLQDAVLSHPAFTQNGLVKGHGPANDKETNFEVQCHTGSLPRAGKHPGKLTLVWDVGEPTQADFLIEVAEPPRLRIATAGRTDIPQGLLGDIAITLKNDGAGELTIVDLDFAPERLEWFRPGKLGLPHTLAAGAVMRVRCVVDAEPLTQGTHRLEVVATWLAGAGGSATVADRKVERHTVEIRVIPAHHYGHFVAFDFGTTNSCVAYWHDEHGAREVRMVPFFDPLSGFESPVPVVVPSVAWFDERNDRWLAGFDALEAAERSGHREHLIRSVKRLLNEGSLSSRRRKVEACNREFDPEEVATAIFHYLKRQTERHLRAKLDRVMITLPANFTDTGVQATLRAVRDAGLEPFQSEEHWQDYRLDEPTASAIDAAKSKRGAPKEEKSVLVFDFGGGTLDVSVLSVSQRADLRQIAVLAHKGANWLGGDDLTAGLMKLIAERYRAEKQVQTRYEVAALRDADQWYDLDEDERAEAVRNNRFLWEAAEKAKIALSADPETYVSVSLSAGGHTEQFDATVTREDFEAEIRNLVADSLRIVDRAIERAQKKRPGIELESVDEVIAAGMTSRIPLVRKNLAQHCKRKEEKLDIYPGFDEKKCVARGACRYAVDNLTLAGTIDEARLECVGIHQFTNCMYGVNKVAGADIAQEQYFECVIPEGSALSGSDGQKPRLYSTRSLSVTRLGEADITVCQHTGNPEDTLIGDNRDIIPIDRIRVRGAPVKDPRRPPALEVRMWIGKDGMLEAEAAVEGHPVVFKLDHRFRV
jgi:molecular chaperone DnaK (HSP70)